MVRLSPACHVASFSFLLTIKNLVLLMFYEIPGNVNHLLLNILDHHTALTFCIFIKFVRLLVHSRLWLHQAKVFQTGQARWTDTSTVRIGPVRKRPGPAATVPVPSIARPHARAWAAMPARWHGTGTARFRGRHGSGTASSRSMEPPAC